MDETAIYDFSSGESTGFSPSHINTQHVDSSTPIKIENLDFEELPSLQRTQRLPCKTKEKQYIVLSSSSSDSDKDESPIHVGIQAVDEPQLIHVSSESSDDQVKDAVIKYHSNKKDIPIFSTPNDTLLTSEIIKLCLGELEDEFICTSKPVSVRYNSVFVINLNNISLRSLYADDNGVWNTGTPRQYFRVEFRDGRVAAVVPGHKHNYTHILKRQYGKHQATYSERGVTFQRIISTLTDKHGHTSRYAVLQYVHRNGTEDDIVMLPHGNQKQPSKRPFMKTDQSVLDSLKEETLDKKPRKLFKEKIEEAGGPLHSSCSASEPRNLQQLYNIRSAKKERGKDDNFTNLIHQAKESAFVHDLTIDGESVQYVLASARQLKDLELCCTHPLQFSILSIDSTYNVGNFFVTNTCFRNLKLVHAEGRYRGKHPHEMGPTFVHTEMGTNNFVSFFSSLLRMNQNLKTIQAIGCDGDEALMNAICICFQDTQRLLCSIHKKDNITRKLKVHFKTREVAINHIISDIFGKDSGSVYQKGLIDSETEVEFDRKLMDLKATWDCLQPDFHTWFVQFEASLFKSHLISSVTRLAKVEKHFSTNQVESTNNNIKDWLGRDKKSSFSLTNRKIEEYVEAQQQEFELAIYGNGPYEISETHNQLRLQRYTWNAMTHVERKEAINKFWNAPVSITKQAESVAENISVKNVDEHAHNKKERPRNLSISSTDIALEVVPGDMLADIWIKAAGILNKSDSIVPAPGYDGLYVLHTHRETQTKIPPHLVTSQKNGKYTCDCRLYKSVKLCEHTVAAAETQNSLGRFVNWRKKDKTDLNLTQLVTGDILSGEKGKVRKPRKGGRTPLDKEPPSKVQERDPLIEDESTAKTLEALDQKEEDSGSELVYLFQTKAQLCYGCSKKFVRNEEQNNLIIRKFCEREYFHNGERKSKWQYAYFHLRNQCVQQKYGDFKKENLVIAKETKLLIPTAVKEKLVAMGLEI